MDEQTYINLLREKSDILQKASFNIVPVCLTHKRCLSCPFYDSSMVNDFNSHCVIILVSHYAIKLRQIADDLEALHKENRGK